MGGLMSSGVGLAANAASLCCTAGLCACQIGQCCMRGTGSGSWNPRAAKAGYLTMLGFSTLLALILRYWSGGITIAYTSWSCDDISSGFHCQGDAAVYRISFVLAIFFLIMMMGSTMSEGWHSGWWAPKLFLFFGMLVGCFFIPNYVFDNNGYAWFARVVSVLFLVLQVLMLVDFGYKWNESWTDKADQNKTTDMDNDAVDTKWLYAILICAAALYIASIAGVAVMYSYYPTGDCSEVSFFISWTLVMIILLTPLSLYREQIVGEAGGGILPAAVVSAYITYLCWSALNSNPDATCNPNYSPDGKPDAANVAIGLIVACVSLMWTSYSASVNAAAMYGNKNVSAEDEAGEAYQLEDGEGDAAAAAEADEDAEGGALTRKAKKTNSAAAATAGMSTTEKKEKGYGEPYWFFHLIMMTGSVYMAMLLTNWGAEEAATEGVQSNAELGKASMWVKIVSQWITIALYIWTLVAPKCCPNREFS